MSNHRTLKRTCPNCGAPFKIHKVGNETAKCYNCKHELPDTPVLKVITRQARRAAQRELDRANDKLQKLEQRRALLAQPQKAGQDSVPGF